MKKLKILSIIGTRPEVIKMAPVIQGLSDSVYIEHILCVTGQHKEMLYSALKSLHIRADHNLNIMKHNQDLFDVTINILANLKEKIELIRPDLILVHGDTTTTLVASLSAFYSRTPLMHIEAGLRTNNKYSPYPEEINRKMTSVLSDFHFAPTAEAKDNLIRENIPHSKIFITGNTAIDNLKHTVRFDYVFSDAIELNKVDFSKKVILVTSHRRENIGQPIKNICFAIKNILANNKDALVIYILHLNPHMRREVLKILSTSERLIILEPLNTLDMHNLIARSYIIMTDSGGLQEEACGLHKPVAVLRDTTERTEGIRVNAVTLIGTNTDSIYSKVTYLLNNSIHYKAMATAKNPFGDGEASSRITQYILYHFGFIKTAPQEFKCI
jgi:UDP-N-acetylglucosamine 2-epimerase